MQATVTPLPGIHVYAPGSQGYIGVSFAVTLPAGWKSTAPGFPEAEPYVFGELKEVVNVYQKPFVITQTITPSVPRAAKSTTLVGTLKYQACTDRVCYPPQEQAVNVVLPALASLTPRSPSSRYRRLTGWPVRADSLQRERAWRCSRASRRG